MNKHLRIQTTSKPEGPRKRALPGAHLEPSEGLPIQALHHQILGFDLKAGVSETLLQGLWPLHRDSSGWRSSSKR